MGETPRGDREAGRHRLESREIERIKESLDEIDRLLAALVEKGGEWDAKKKQATRQQILALMQSVGIKGFEDYEGLMKVHEKVRYSYQSFPAPSGYPEREEFVNRLMKIYNAREPENSPHVPDHLKAVDVALHGRSDWPRLEGRGGEHIVDYLYRLGTLMHYEHAYKTVFDETDQIEVNNDWEITNGRHRALTLKVLGREYIQQGGVDEWVRVQREE